MDCPLPQWGEVKAAADFILSETERQHVACVVLGSGLSDWAEAQQDSLEIVNIPHFPKPTVPGHAGRVFSIVVNDQPVLVMAGRVHRAMNTEMGDLIRLFLQQIERMSKQSGLMKALFLIIGPIVSEIEK